MALVQLRESEHAITPIFWGSDELGTLTGRERVIGDEMVKAMEIVSACWTKRHTVMDEAPEPSKGLQDLNLLGRLYWALTKRIP